jgi:hypothetical protein
MTMTRKPFTYTIHSSDRATGGSASAYSIYQVRELLGDWKATVRVAPFIANGNLDAELRIRGDGICHECSNPTDGWASILTIIPGTTQYPLMLYGSSNAEGMFIINGGLRGPIDVKWVAAHGAPASTANFYEHSIHIYFEPI